jgi:hypothetical protein
MLEHNQMVPDTIPRYLAGLVRLTLSARTFIVLLAVIHGAASETNQFPGLNVQNGVLMLRGKPFHGIGVNYFSLASRILENPNDASSLTNLARLASARVPFVRFMCGGFWPAQQELDVTNREEFFKRLDRVVECAEKNRIGLIPSLFWNLATVCDLAHEPLHELGQTNSRSIALLRAYTKDVVSRYRRSPAIWGWEFGNESSLSADLPNAAQHRPLLAAEMGTPRTRTELDELKSSDLHVALVEFGRTVRELDLSRPIFSGNALPRPSAWHNTHETNWIPDNAEQFRAVLRRDNPDPINTISVHIYDGEGFPAGAHTFSEIVTHLVREAQAAGKPLFIGEFGLRNRASRDEQQPEFGRLLNALEQRRVPLAAVWVFDYPEQNQQWNITFDNERAAFLETIRETNRRIALLNQ